MTGLRSVVTGGAGFIGSHLVDLLVAEGHEVLVIDDLSTGIETNLDPRARHVRLDIRDVDGLRAAIHAMDFVFHAAALPRIQPSFDDPVPHEEVNVLGTINVVMASVAAGVRKVVFSGSSAVYGDPQGVPTAETECPRPLSPYAVQKLSAEQSALMLGERHGIAVVSLRYFNVYGPRSYNPKNPYNAYSSVVGIFLQQRRQGAPLTVTGTGQQSRDFVHVSDVARANLLAALADRAGEVYNVGSGTALSIMELAKMFRHPIEMIEERRGEARITLADITKIERHLDWHPTIDLRRYIEEAAP